MSRTKKLVLAAILLVAVAAALPRILGPGEVVSNSPARPGPIIAFGDSLTQGVGAGPGQTYPERLGKLLGREVVNRGVGGETASEALRRIERDVISQNPGAVVILLGGNDLLQRRDPNATFKALDEAVERCAKSGALVVLVGIQGLPMVSPDFAPRFAELAERRGCVHVPDILDGIFGDPKLMADGVHPNAAGYEIVAERIAKRIKPHLR